MMDTFEKPPIKFSGLEAHAARQAWGCNCGPCALAACLGLTLEEIRRHLAVCEFEKKGYMNPSMMRATIQAAGFVISAAAELIPQVESLPDCLPLHGIVRIQWGGPWTEPGANPRWAYRYTHWIATKRNGELWVFDINCGWTKYQQWACETARLIPASITGAYGTFFTTHCWEIRRGRSEERTKGRANPIDSGARPPQ